MRAPACALAVALFAYASSGLFGQISDTRAPQLVSLTIDPAAVDVTSAPATVNITTRVTDDLAGVQSVCVTLRSPSLQQTQFNCSARISGTTLDGMYRASVEIPRYAESGTWNVASLQLRDNAGNNIGLSTASLQAMGIGTVISVTSISDTQAPSLASLTITPSIDISSGAQNVIFTLQITDNLSGLDLIRFVGFRMQLRSPTGRQAQYIAAQDFVQKSGDSLNGTYEIIHSMPALSEAGTWTIASLILLDKAGNQNNLNSLSLANAGLPSSFTVINSNQDIDAPQITSLGFAPTVIDTSDDSRQVRITLGLTDNSSGVDFSPDHPFVSTSHGIVLRSPSGSQTISCCFFPPTFTLVSGNNRNGTWAANVVFPRYSEAGTWLVSIQSVKDAVQNRLNLTAGDLALRGLPNHIDVFRPSGDVDATIPASGGTVFDKVFLNRAMVTFPPNALSQPTDVAIDVLTTPPPIPAPTGFGSPSMYVTIKLTPEPPFPLPPPGLTVTIPLPAFRIPGTGLVLFRLDPATGGIVPAVSVTGGNVTGVVNSDGLSATFAGVSRLSTVVAFTPNPNSVLGDVNHDGSVTCADLAIIRASFGRRTGAAGFNAQADLNNDGIIDIRDLSMASRQLPAGAVCR